METPTVNCPIKYHITFFFFKFFRYVELFKLRLKYNEIIENCYSPFESTHHVIVNVHEHRKRRQMTADTARVGLVTEINPTATLVPQTRLPVKERRLNNTKMAH